MIIYNSKWSRHLEQFIRYYNPRYFKFRNFDRLEYCRKTTTWSERGELERVVNWKGGYCFSASYHFCVSTQSILRVTSRVTFSAGLDSYQGFPATGHDGVKNFPPEHALPCYADSHQVLPVFPKGANVGRISLFIFQSTTALQDGNLTAAVLTAKKAIRSSG